MTNALFTIIPLSQFTLLIIFCIYSDTVGVLSSSELQLDQCTSTPPLHTVILRISFSGTTKIRVFFPPLSGLPLCSYGQTVCNGVGRAKEAFGAIFMHSRSRGFRVTVFLLLKLFGEMITPVKRESKLILKKKRTPYLHTKISEELILQKSLYVRADGIAQSV